MMNACASHYLADAFAAGHLRTPMAELVDPLHQGGWTIFGPKRKIAQNIVNYAHNTDNMLGLVVENRKGERWVAYGDRCQGPIPLAGSSAEKVPFTHNDENRRRQLAALDKSVAEVIEAYLTENPDLKPADSDVFQSMPWAEKVQDPVWSQSVGNFPPTVYAKSSKEGSAPSGAVIIAKKEMNSEPGLWEYKFNPPVDATDVGGLHEIADRSMKKLATHCRREERVFLDPNAYSKAPNVGNFGGICTCPDGQKYEVGDNFDSCGSLACIGGTTDGGCKKRASGEEGAGMRVICAVRTAPATATFGAGTGSGSSLSIHTTVQPPEVLYELIDYPEGFMYCKGPSAAVRLFESVKNVAACFNLCSGDSTPGFRCSHFIFYGQSGSPSPREGDCELVDIGKCTGGLSIFKDFGFFSGGQYQGKHIPDRQPCSAKDHPCVRECQLRSRVGFSQRQQEGIHGGGATFERSCDRREGKRVRGEYYPKPCHQF